MKNIHIYLCRHSQSEGNLDTKIVGQTGTTKLTKLGHLQAEALGERFADDGIIFDKIISSTYLRAQETAKTIRERNKSKCDIDYDERLIEYNPGEWLGKNRNEIMSDIPTMKKFHSLAMSFKFPGKNGESLNQVQRRAMSAIEDRITYNDEVLKAVEDKKQNIAIVSHGMTCKAILNQITGWDQSFLWRTRIENASITHLVYKPDEGWFLRGLNDIAHLTKLK